jgi:dienelactone hydrolase
MSINRYAALVSVALFSLCVARAQTPPAASMLKDEMRNPWKRGDDNFLRLWVIAGPFSGTLDTDCLRGQGGEAGIRPVDGMEQKGPDGRTTLWHSQKSWGDDVGFDELKGSPEEDVCYAFTTVQRPGAGKALLSIGSSDGVRVWLNGRLVHSWDGLRSSTPDEDQIGVDMNAGENRLLVKVHALGRFCARILETGALPSRNNEIGPSLVALSPDGFTIKTDIGAERTAIDAVNVEVIRPGGDAVFTTTAPRGARVDIDARKWPDGPYEVRLSTRTVTGLLYATQLPWYKGNFLPKAEELAAAATAADATKPEGFTLKMLATMVEDRLGCKLGDVRGNPWRKVHSPLMEYDEMMLERDGQVGRIRAGGFVRLAYLDEVDGSPQYCRAYLPVDYDPAKKWPVVIQMHGYNPANPVYVRWWGADERHAGIGTEFSGHQSVIYVEPHGRGNTQYLGMGDKDIVTVIAEVKRLFNVDEDRIYLTGDSMGGWGTWNVATRHPDLFAAIAPVFGGSDYHAQMPEEALSRLGPLDRFLLEKQSSWAMADGLLNTPIFVHHGDADQSVNVEYSRWGVRLLQRWGYDVRYHEYPGRVHEALGNTNGNLNIEWFLQHRRNPDPRHVRIRSAELRNASAYWVQIRQTANPLDFMALDAEVVDDNVIRLDTRNILDIELTPSTVLVDHSKPVRVVWNGAAREMNLDEGGLHLAMPGYSPATLHKNSRLPGSIADFAITPFAVVIGTVSKDTAMAALCRAKASSFIESWRVWQNQQPRVFDDTAMGESDLARYSLLLVGGAEANRVTARLAAGLPYRVSPDRVVIDGREFPARDAALQMIYPHPLNADRYVWIVDGTSAGGMYFNELNPQRPYDWDFVVADGIVPAYKQRASVIQTRVVSGMFDCNWRFNDSLVQRGDTEIRAKGRLRRRPNENLSLSPRVLDSYVGRYQITQGPVVEIVKAGGRLKAKMQGSEGDALVPESETSFSIPKYGAWVNFVRSASGKVTGFVGYQDGDFEGKKLDR